MLERGTKVVLDPENPQSVRIGNQRIARRGRTLVCQANGDQETTAERREDCRTIVAALNSHLNDSPVLLVSEDGGISQVAEIDGSIIEAVDEGIMDAVRFHDGSFQQHDGTEWVALEEGFSAPPS